MGTSRLFIAVPLPDTIIHAIEELANKWTPEFPFQKWSHPADYHITLKFLGDTEDTQIQVIKEQVDSALTAASCAPFSLNLHKPGTFGKPSTPSVLWLGVAGEMTQLYELQEEVDQAAAKLGFNPEDRSYSPHITIARRYQGTDGLNVSTLEDTYTQVVGVNDLSWDVSEIVLYKSHTQRRPMYEPIHRWGLHSVEEKRLPIQ
jgi:RNA 2',3'-cyclic 3'-phosphodiesterase